MSGLALLHFLRCSNPPAGFMCLRSSQAYTQIEWKGVQQWNPPSLLTLAPGESKTYGVKFLVSKSIRDIEPTLAANGRPVAVGIPGYILPTDLDARLFFKYERNVKSIAVEPKSAIAIRNVPPTPGGWIGRM